jgi:hypothetical protein
MKGGEVMGHDDVQIEVWRNLVDMAIVWLTSIFNHIFLVKQDAQRVKKEHY